MFFDVSVDVQRWYPLMFVSTLRTCGEAGSWRSPPHSGVEARWGLLGGCQSGELLPPYKSWMCFICACVVMYIGVFTFLHVGWLCVSVCVHTEDCECDVWHCVYMCITVVCHHVCMRMTVMRVMCTHAHDCNV